MREKAFAIAARLWPSLAGAGQKPQALGAATTWSLLYAAPLAAVGLVWLGLWTDLALLAANLPVFLLLLLLWWLLARFEFAWPAGAGYFRAWGALGRLVTWSAALIFGPTALWLEVAGAALGSLRWWRPSPLLAPLPHNRAWIAGRRLSLSIARETLSGLVALWAYQQWFNGLPLAGLAPAAVLPALYATLLRMSLIVLLMLPAFLLHLYLERPPSLLALFNRFLQFASLLFLFYLLPEPFAVLAAGLYAEGGLWVYLFFLGGLLLFTFLAHWLSRVALGHQQRAQQLARLEQLSHALLHRSVDDIDLAELLAVHAPRVFEHCQIEIRLFPDYILYYQKEDWLPVADTVWWALQATPEPYLLWRDAPLAINGGRPGSALTVPVITVESRERVGGIYIWVDKFAGDVLTWLPAAQSLATQIAAVLHRIAAHEQALASQAEIYQQEIYSQAYQTELYAQALAYQKMSQELALAWQIQASFLPKELPDVPGWQLAVTLEPARETSGDYYDFIPLPDGRLGILIADVADKGIGAALYMALSRTLIRTYALEHAHRPDRVLALANERILADTRSDLFVTVFYAILDPQAGLLTYCNAGHNPPYLWQSQNGNLPCPLVRTSLPLGVLEDIESELATVNMMPGDVLVLYTDGIVEAQDGNETFFGEERLQAVTQAHLGRSAEVIESKLISAVYDFVGDEPQFDDITLMVLVRE